MLRMPQEQAHGHSQFDLQELLLSLDIEVPVQVPVSLVININRVNETQPR